jgi:hypothetical protein
MTKAGSVGRSQANLAHAEIVRDVHFDQAVSERFDAPAGTSNTGSILRGHPKLREEAIERHKRKFDAADRVVKRQEKRVRKKEIKVRDAGGPDLGEDRIRRKKK